MTGNYTRTAAGGTIVKDAGPYEALVVNNLDPKYMGSLEVELLKYTSSGNSPERSGELVTVRYLSPFYGVTSSRGIGVEDGYANTQKSYGFWAVPPDIGSRVLVIFAEGNPNFGFWIGCIPDDYMNFMVPDGRASTERTTSDTPQNLVGAKLPVGEYNKLIETGELVDPTLFEKPYNKDFTDVLEVQGLIFDESRGTTTTSARRDSPSMVFGWSTPGPADKRAGNPRVELGPEGRRANMPFNRLGGSSFVMDDGDEKFIRSTHAEEGPPFYINKSAGETGGDETIPQNELVRIRTRTGHQILLHNSEDLIYIGNSRGTAWIEITSDGKIDIHAQDSISVMSNNDINFTAERDFNVEAGRNINMKATARWSDGSQYLDNKESGRIQIESAWDTNYFVGHDYKLTAKGNGDIAIDLDLNTTVKQSHHVHANQNINVTADKNIHMKTGHSFYRTADRTMHDNVAQSYMLKAANVDASIGFNYRLTTGGLLSQQVGTEYRTTAGGAVTRQSGASIHDEAAVSINLLSGSFIAGNAGEVHWNTPGQAKPGTPAGSAQNALQAQPALDADRARPLSTITLPFVFPGAQQPVPYESILTRAPQHEPWSHHENINPQAFKKEQTDREDPGMLAGNDRVVTPDTFAKNLGSVTTSQTVLNSGNIPGFDGGTGDGGITNGTEFQGSVSSFDGDIQIDTARGNPGNVTTRFFVGDGPLGTIKTKKRGLTAQVAELFVPNFQGFIDELEDTGYEIKTLLGYAKRQTVSGGSWSVHASGGAIDINPPNPVHNTFPNGFYSPRPANAPMTDMPPNTITIANKHGLGWGGAWSSIDDAMHFSARKNEGGAFDFPRGFIPQGPSSERDDSVPAIEDDAADFQTPSDIDDSNLPGPQNADGSARAQ